jgi:hypothetical protein
MSDLLQALWPYIPAPLLQTVLDHLQVPTAPTVERSPATALFADISGLTPLAEPLARSGEGPEELTHLLNTCFSPGLLGTNPLAPRDR